MTRILRHLSLVGFVVIIAGITVVMTRALIVHAATQTTNEAVHPGGRTINTVNPPKNVFPVPDGMVRAAHLPQMNVEVAHQQVAVSGKAEVYDTIPGIRYIWLLRVYESKQQRRLIQEHHYLDHARILPEGEVTMNHAFSDIFDLPAGDYKVELTMYGVSPKFQVNDIKFGEDLRPKSLLKVSRFQKIKISE